MKKIILSIVVFLLTFQLFCNDFVSLNDIFTTSDIEKLKKGDLIARMYLKYNPSNVNTDLEIKIPKTKFTSEDYSVYEMIVDDKAFIPYNLTDESKLKLYNSLTSYSKLKGMQYFSRRIGQTQTLILNSFRIDSSNNRSQKDDITYSKIEPMTTNYFLQEDNKFGKLVFKSELYNNDNDFVLVNTCAQAIFPFSNKGDYKIISFFIYDSEAQGYFYYSVNLMRIRIGLEILVKKTDATLFSNRIRAGTVHIAKLLGLDLSAKITPWENEKLDKGFYKNY
ncbi:MAG: hypothetical protein A2086_11110 [Spirochaetes bacterium GWD1_27_9]|nr:MAG: hypothetical protein A2Z98_01570 [Spirochaetes bacterium GWB1_27_13]OHD22767.1 MAG: hypothetical protein A2Y34_00180 [Spirochaetes bacterium GWC1_27_15]OHD39099.1 MAG: hypothetical protein A2086_11110 [Spirochaetes bacterium GWD1_27_9]